MNRATAVMLTVMASMLTVAALTGCSARKPVSAADALPASAPTDIAQTVADLEPAEVPEPATDAAAPEPAAPTDTTQAAAPAPERAPAPAVDAPPPAPPKSSAQAAAPREPAQAPAPATKASQPPPPAKPTPPQPLPAAEQKAQATKPLAPPQTGNPGPAEPFAGADEPTGTVVTGTIVTVSKVPDPATVPYDTCVTFVKYKVNSVVNGSYGGDELLAVFWGMRDGKLEPAARFTTGQRHRLTVEPFSERTELSRVMQADDTSEYGLTPYWVAAYTKS